MLTFCTHCTTSLMSSAYLAVRDRQEVLYQLPKGTDSYAYVGSMTVDEQYRRRGVALAMLAQAEQIARACLPNRLEMWLCIDMHELPAEPPVVHHRCLETQLDCIARICDEHCCHKRLFKTRL